MRPRQGTAAWGGLLGGTPGTLLQSRWPSRQRQLLQSSTQELPCGKGRPWDQQGLPNMITVGKGVGSAVGTTAWRLGLALVPPGTAPGSVLPTYRPGTGGRPGPPGSCSDSR